MRRYILQQMNTSVFPNTFNLMRNIEFVTDILQAKGQETSDVVRTRDGETYTMTKSDPYRVYSFIENTVDYNLVPDLEVFGDAGRLSDNSRTSWLTLMLRC